LKPTRITSWHISCGSDTERSLRESIFSIANGYIGTRGFRPDERGKHAAWRSTFISGFYEYIRPGITDLVNQPDFSAMALRLNGEDTESMHVFDFTQSLDMSCGLLEWSFFLESRDGLRTKIKMEKFISMANRHIAALRISVMPVNWSGSLYLETGIDASVQNLPISDNQLHNNIEFVQMWNIPEIKPIDGGAVLTAKTFPSHRQVTMAYVLNADENAALTTDDYSVTSVLETTLKCGTCWQAEKLVAVACFRDGDSENIARSELELIRHESFDALLDRSKKAWGRLWETSDVVLEGDETWQGGVRYIIFQLLQAAPRHDPHASIGARGLTHGRYKGCYFWDTEIYMLPMFTMTQPEIAKNLLLYRYNTLPDAVKSAKNFSAKGARYSWMASDTGFEQCETWDTGCCEIHVTADIAFAFGKYTASTGDDQFLCCYGTELYIQTARYWVDRFNYSAKEDRYHLLFVKGPDEYCGVTSNDFYTVSMARQNLRLAIDAVSEMKQRWPEEWQDLSSRLSFNDNEIAVWQNIIDKSVLTFDEKRGLWLQDVTFEYMEPLDIKKEKDGDKPLYLRIGYDRLQRYQVLKQPAVLMYMALCPEDFSKDEIETAWNYYEPKTLHDSTLSFGIHALVASRLGKTPEAVRYFEKSLFLDLFDLMNNTGHEGIHMASLGASWQALIFGFGGLSHDGEYFKVVSRLPEQIHAMRYRFFFKGHPYEAEIKQGDDPIIRELT
jgi:kojibiose phosphorylase